MRIASMSTAEIELQVAKYTQMLSAAIATYQSALSDPAERQSCANFSEALMPLLEQRLEAAAGEEWWLYFRVPCTVEEINSLIAGTVRTYMLELEESGAITRWWWLCKSDFLGPHIRLRLQLSRAPTPQGEADITTKLESLLTRRLFNVPYEPEIGLFGGETGLQLAHESFHMDSVFLANWFSIHDKPNHLSSGLSVALLHALLAGAKLDAFEQWDVWRWIVNRRPVNDDSQLHIEEILPQLRRIMQAESAEVWRLFPAKEQALLGTYANYLRDLGHELYTSHMIGQLTRGLRAVAGAIILFHWNRAGIDVIQQARISRALMSILEPV
jgi:thiopeptide-type bacteriocin biosynthesis protein